MFRRSLLLTSLIIVPWMAATAQSKGTAEIGSSLGVTVLSANGSSLTHIGVPGAGVAASPTLYLSYISANVMVEPQLSLAIISGGGSTQTALGAAMQFGYLFTPGQRGSGYVEVNAALQSFKPRFGSSETGTGFGGGLGYRTRVGQGLAIRFDARYRHWLGALDGLNEIAFGIGFAGIL